MCPACLANTVGLLTGAVSSAAVATAYLFKKYRKEKTVKVVSRMNGSPPASKSCRKSWVRHHDKYPDSA